MPRPFTFVHAADLHLGVPFSGVSAEDGQVSRALVAATYDALDRVLDACLAPAPVDALLLAGDVYDGHDRSYYAESRFERAMRRLADAGVDVLVAHGNHDPADSASLRLSLPDNVRHFPADSVGRVAVERDGELIAAVYGRSFGRRDVTENLAQDFRRGPGDPLAVGVLHTNVGGRREHEPYAPCSVDDLRAARFDYWALGHIHKPEILAEDPPIVYAGSPQGLNPKETGPHGCYRVELSASGARVEFVPTAGVVWGSAEIDVSGLPDLDAVRAGISAECERLREEAGEPVVTRLDLVGRSDAHRALAGSALQRDLLQELREDQMSRTPWLWVDRLRDSTASAIDLGSVRGAGDFAGELARIADELLADPNERERLLGEVTEGLERYAGPLETELSSAEIVERARDICLDRLLPEAQER